MVAPTTAKGRRSRQRILDAAAELFGKQGVHATGLNQVLERAGASKSQLYHYFETKNELIRAVIACRRDLVMAGQGPLIDEVDSFASLDRWLRSVVAAQEQQDWRGGCPIGSLANELADTDEQARVDLDGCFSEWRNQIAAALGRMQARDLLRPEADPDLLARSVLATIEGGLLLSRSERGPQSLEAALDGVTQMLRFWAT